MKQEGVVSMTHQQAAWRWTRGYVQNVGAAIALAVVDDRANGRVYNLGEKSALTEQAWVEEIGKAAGSPVEIARVSDDDLPEDLRQPFDYRYELMTDTTRIRDELSYSEVISSEEALKRTVEWEQTRRGPADLFAMDS
jgi:nucleoside-diphosphate-sugar epimerase